MFIGAVGKVVDGQGNLEAVSKLERRLAEKGLRTHELKIAALEMRWGSVLPQNYLKGACSPMQAVEIAKSLFDAGQADALILRGTDCLKSNYDRASRREYMRVFDGGKTHLDGYAELAGKFAERHEISQAEFRSLADALFSNYLRTFNRRDPNRPKPAAKWFDPINDYFRGVDCANPNVDFSGAIILMTAEAADRCDVPDAERVLIKGCQLRKRGSDGFDSLPKIAKYDHLNEVYCDTCNEAGVDFSSAFLKGKAALEVYTCYPVVPLAFLLSSNFVSNPSRIPGFLSSHEITVTGGLNLCRAPWNNTTLNTIIEMVHLLQKDPAINLAGIHGNGSLGYQQAFMILSTEENREGKQ